MAEPGAPDLPRRDLPLPHDPPGGGLAPLEDPADIRAGVELLVEGRHPRRLRLPGRVEGLGRLAQEPEEGELGVPVDAAAAGLLEGEAGEANRTQRKTLGVAEFVERLEVRDQPDELRDAAVVPERLEDLLRHLEPVDLPGIHQEPLLVPDIEKENLDEGGQHPGLRGGNCPPDEEPPKALQHGGRRAIPPRPLDGEVGVPALGGGESSPLGRHRALLQEPGEG